MGLGQSQTLNKDDAYEKPSPEYQATLYYFAGRGLADQIRWMLAAANVEFTQKVYFNVQRLHSNISYELSLIIDFEYTREDAKNVRTTTCFWSNSSITNRWT